MKVIAFDVGGQPCVMSVHELIEILPYRELLAVPDSVSRQGKETGLSPIGILDYRGKAVPVLVLSIAPASAPVHAEPPSGDPRGSGAYRRLLIIGKNRKSAGCRFADDCPRGTSGAGGGRD